MFTSADKVHLGVILTIDILAIIANITIMFAILFRTPKPLKTYSIFLLNNAIIDLFSATSSALGTVRLVEDHAGGSMIFVFLGPCTLISEHLCRLCQGLHVNLVLQSTIVLLLSFAYRVYILGDVVNREPPGRLVVWACCIISYMLIALPITAYYFVQTDLAPEVMQRFNLEGYTTANFYLFGTQALIVNINAVILSPIVMIIIFVVRRNLVRKISKIYTGTDKKQHALIARALTYQMLLPCGVGGAATVWILDLTQIWSSEFTERLIMVLFNIFSLASPLINFTVLPPYRALLPFAPKQSQISGAVAPIDFTSMAG